jgi:signal transduction histidine kinase
MQLPVLSAISGLGFGLLVSVSFRAGSDGGPVGAVLLNLVVLLAACTVAAVFALRPRVQVSAPALPKRRHDHDASEAPTRLLAQMHHELRTPLNAMIGFSEVMLRELHGPLGHARYQEYAAHISESGGRLLKASEDALAVAATMSALVGDRRALRRERLSAADLLREAWVAAGAPGRQVQLSIDDGGAAEIECDRQATSEALQHLLGEAVARTPRGGVMLARGGRSGIEIAAGAPVAPTGGRAGIPAADCGRPAGHSEGGDGLRLVLARSLIEMQGATLSVSAGRHREGWTARIRFPVDEDWKPWNKPFATPEAGWPAFPARRGGSAGGAALHASAGTRAAPPASG